MKNHLALSVSILSAVTLELIALVVAAPISAVHAHMSLQPRNVRIKLAQLDSMALDGPEATYEGARVVHNVVIDGQKGMRIHAKFTVKHGENVSCRLIAYFFNEDGSPILANEAKYRDAEGRVSAHADFKPQYDPAEYDDLQIFVPYAALNLGESGEYDLKFYLALYDLEAKRFFERSGWYKFKMTK